MWLKLSTNFAANVIGTMWDAIVCTCSSRESAVALRKGKKKKHELISWDSMKGPNQ